MSEFDIDRFEKRVETLLDAHRRLQRESRSLRAENDALLRRNDELSSRVEAVIERMKVLEQQEQEP